MPVSSSDSRWPLVTFTVTGEITDAEIEDLFRRLNVYFNRKKPFGLVFDLSNGKSPGVSQLSLMAELSKKNADNERLYSLGVALVAASAIVRVALKAVHTLQPPIAPHAVVATVAEAESWVIGMIKKAGLAMPAKMG